jgi:hypothetical protein
MPFLNSPVLKKYTAPTCSLEILARAPVNKTDWRRSDQAPHSFQLQIHYLEFGTSAIAAATDPTQLSIALRGTLDQLQTLHQAVQTYLYKFLGKTDLSQFADEPVTVLFSSNDIALIPKTLTQHTLQLGSLASDLSIPAVELASTQLLDLSTTLDSYAHEAVKMVRQRQPRLGRWSQATQVAAVGVAAMGITGLVASLMSYSLLPQLASNDAQNSDTALKEPRPEAQGSLPGLPVGPSLSSGKAAETSPGLAFGPILPPGVIAGISAGTRTPIPKPNSTIGKLTVPPIPIPRSSQLPSPAVLFTPGDPKAIAFTPRPTSRTSTPLSDMLASRLPETQSPSPLIPPAPLIPNAAPAQPAPATSAFQTGERTRNQAPRSQPLQTLTPLGKQAPQQDSKLATGSTAFDTIQQISEVRQYFQDRWQPANADQVLEYRLMLNSDGSLWQIVPLGEAAGRNLDRTGMPSVGATFVSPIPRNQKAKIRLVLFPDGKVQTFLEGLTP